MTPLLLFLLGCAVTYLGTVSAAFNALMRLSLRIHAERTDRDDQLGWYLEDPRRFFIPARVLISTLTMVAAALLARVTGLDRAGFPVLLLAIVAIVVTCEHLIPLLIVRRDPERVLDVLLPSFDVIARLLRPLTAGMLRMGTSNHRKGQSSVRRNHSGVRKANGKGEPAAAAVEVRAPAAATEAEAAQEGQARELLRKLADFRETMVREVMTPRPDIIAIDSDATIEQLLTLFREQQYSRVPVFKETLDNVQGFVFIKDVIQRLPTSALTRTDRATGAAGALRARDQAGARSAQGVPAPPRADCHRRRRIRRHRRPGHRRRPARGDRRRDPRRVRRRGRAHRRRRERQVPVERQRARRRDGQPDEGHHRRRRVRNRRRLPVVAAGPRAAVGEHMEVDGLDVEIVDTQRRRITRVRMSRLEPVPAPENEATA